MGCKVALCPGAEYSLGFCDKHYMADWRAKNRQAVNARKRAAYARNPHKVRETVRLGASGFTKELLEARRSEQAGRCAICPATLEAGVGSGRGECCDHYETLGGERVAQQTPGAKKHPRGLLCVACNTGLGFYERYQRPAGLAIEPYDSYIARFSGLAPWKP